MSDEQVRVLYVAATPESAADGASALEAVTPELDVRGTTADRVRETLEAERVDCVVSEHDLGDTDGVSLLADVEASAPSILTVLFSAQSSVKLVRETYDAGIDEFVHDIADEQLHVLAHRIEERVGSSALGQSDATVPHLRALAETARDVIIIVDDESIVRFVNPAVESVLGYEPTELVGEPLTKLMTDDLATRHRAGVQAYLKTDEKTLDWANVEFPGLHADGHEVPLNISFGEYHDGNEHFFTGIARDVTERRRREKQLTLLNETGQSLSAAETDEEVAQITVRAARELLDLPITSVELYDAENRLRSAARTERVDELVGDGPLFSGEEPLPWTVFAEQEAVNYDDRDERTELDESDTPLQSAILLPVSRYGVFVSGDTEPAAFDDSDVTLANVLVGHARTALDSVRREQAVRAQRDELSAKNERLERLNRINEVVRDLTQSVLQASTREEIEQVVCTQLASVDPYRFAWIGERAATGGDVVPKASAGVELDFLDEYPVAADENAPGTRPAERALDARDVQMENDLHVDAGFEPWRSAALQRGYRSSVSVPLAYRDTVYGALTLYAAESGVFDETEVAVLREFGELIGYAINTLERKKALVDDTTVELEFTLSDPSFPATSVAREVDGRIEFESLVQRADGSLHAFFTVSGADSERALEAVARSPFVGDASVVDDRDGETLFEVTMTELSESATLLDYGAHLTALTATPEAADLTVELPRSGNIRSFLEMFLQKYDGVELVARRERDRPISTPEELTSSYRERLTSRQAEVLETAYESGFFDWPRNATGKQLAEILGVSQPTVSRHIREGERKLFELVFEDGSAE